MKFRTTIILLALVIGLGAFLLIYTARQPSVSAFKEEQTRLFAGSEFQEPGASRQLGSRTSRRSSRCAAATPRSSWSARPRA